MALKGKKILITGGLGFIGKNFILHRPEGWEVFAADIIEDKKFQKTTKNCRFFKVDLSDKKQVKNLVGIIGQNFDICLYLAGNGDPAISVTQPGWDLRSTTLSLINTGEYFKFKKLVYLSSGAVYDGLKGLVSPALKVAPKLPYSITHLADEYYVQHFAKIGQIDNYLIIRFFGAYGPYEPSRKIYSKLVKTFAIEKKDFFTIRGDGQNYIDAMYVEEGVRALVKVIESSKVNLTIDLCSGNRMKIDELVRRAGEVFGRKVQISHQGQVPEYIEFFASPAEFQRLFGFRAKISLEEGLRKLYKFIKLENS